MKSILLLCSIQYYVITSTIILIWVGIIIFIIYILRNTHQKVVLQILIRKWVLTNQRSKLWFSHVKKNDTSNQNRERCFFTCEKNDTSNQKPQRRVSFASKFSPFIVACSAASHTFKEKSFTRRVFLAKKWKTFRKWSGIVPFVSLSIKKTVESRRNKSGKG